MKTAKETLTNNLRKLREMRCLTQSALAEAAGLSLVGYQKIEYGERWPRPPTALKIADALGVPVLHLYMDQGDLDRLHSDPDGFDKMPTDVRTAFLEESRRLLEEAQEQQRKVDDLRSAVRAELTPILDRLSTSSPLLSRIEALGPAGKAKIEALLKALEQEQARSRIDKELDTPYVGLGVKKPTKSKQSK